jgi:nucleoside-diphosphate-sugar epimerase
MTTLIVGCGYLGRRIGARLSANGERVVGTVRSVEAAASLARWRIEPWIADVLRPNSFDRLPGFERIVYCVGFDRGAGASMRSVYVDGLSAVAPRLRRDIERLVYVSSTGVYGQDDGGWVDETSPTVPRHESGRICLEAERLVRAIHEEKAVRTIVIRYAGLYGPGRIVRRDAVARGAPLIGDPDRYLNLIHIDDAASAAMAVLDAPDPDDLYLAADDRPVPRREYYEEVARCLGAPTPRFQPPLPESVEARREDSNKRVSNRTLRERLGLELRFPDIASGVPDALGRADEPDPP